MTWDEVVSLGRALPSVETATCYGTPALRVAGKLLCRVWEDGETLVLLDTPIQEREAMIEADAEIYYFTDHYRDYPAVLCRLPAASAEHVEGYLRRSWRKRAPKKLVKAEGR